MASHTKEIVTLQLGHYSNFVGCHWWNLQEAAFIYDSKDKGLKEINNDVLFREGENLLGEVTYTPRLIAVDLKGSLNSLKKEGTLYSLHGQEDCISWPGDISLHKAQTAKKNEFLRDLDVDEASYRNEEVMGDDEEEDEEKERTISSHETKSHQKIVFGSEPLYNLDECVNVWSDFLKIHLHPKTISFVDSFTHRSDTNPFSVFNYGKSVYEDRKFQYELDDNLHFFVEECDRLQGFQVLVDVHDGFGGIASSVLEDVEDQFGKTIFSIGTMPTQYGECTAVGDTHRVINSLLSFTSLAERSALVLPLTCASSQWRKPGDQINIPHLSYNGKLSYHTSGILASCLDTATLPLRTDVHPIDLSDITSMLSIHGRKIASLQASFPFSLTFGEFLVDKLMKLENKPPWYPLSLTEPSTDIFAQSVVLRGIRNQNIKSSSPHTPRSISSCHTARDVLQLYIKETQPSTHSVCTALNTPCKTGEPFPHIFDPVVSSDGVISTNHRPPYQGVNSVPVLTAMQTTSNVGHMLRNLRKESGRIDIRKHHAYVEGNMDIDEYKEVLEKLDVLISNYSTTSDNL